MADQPGVDNDGNLLGVTVGIDASTARADLEQHVAEEMAAVQRGFEAYHGRPDAAIGGSLYGYEVPPHPDAEQLARQDAYQFSRGIAFSAPGTPNPNIPWWAQRAPSFGFGTVYPTAASPSAAEAPLSAAVPPGDAAPPPIAPEVDRWAARTTAGGDVIGRVDTGYVELSDDDTAAIFSRLRPGGSAEDLADFRAGVRQANEPAFSSVFNSFAETRARFAGYGQRAQGFARDYGLDTFGQMLGLGAGEIGDRIGLGSVSETMGRLRGYGQAVSGFAAESGLSSLGRLAGLGAGEAGDWMQRTAAGAGARLGEAWETFTGRNGPAMSPEGMSEGGRMDVISEAYSRLSEAASRLINAADKQSAAADKQEAAAQQQEAAESSSGRSGGSGHSGKFNTYKAAQARRAEIRTNLEDEYAQAGRSDEVGSPGFNRQLQRDLVEENLATEPGYWGNVRKGMMAWGGMALAYPLMDVAEGAERAWKPALEGSAYLPDQAWQETATSLIPLATTAAGAGIGAFFGGAGAVPGAIVGGMLGKPLESVADDYFGRKFDAERAGYLIGSGDGGAGSVQAFSQALQDATGAVKDASAALTDFARSGPVGPGYANEYAAVQGYLGTATKQDYTDAQEALSKNPQLYPYRQALANGTLYGPQAQAAAEIAFAGGDWAGGSALQAIASAGSANYGTNAWAAWNNNWHAEQITAQGDLALERSQSALDTGRLQIGMLSGYGAADIARAIPGADQHSRAVIASLQSEIAPLVQLRQRFAGDPTAVRALTTEINGLKAQQQPELAAMASRHRLLLMTTAEEDAAGYGYKSSGRAYGGASAFAMRGMAVGRYDQLMALAQSPLASPGERYAWETQAQMLIAANDQQSVTDLGASYGLDRTALELRGYSAAQLAPLAQRYSGALDTMAADPARRFSYADRQRMYGLAISVTHENQMQQYQQRLGYDEIATGNAGLAQARASYFGGPGDIAAAGQEAAATYQRTIADLNRELASGTLKTDERIAAERQLQSVQQQAAANIHDNAVAYYSATTSIDNSQISQYGSYADMARLNGGSMAALGMEGKQVSAFDSLISADLSASRNPALSDAQRAAFAADAAQQQYRQMQAKLQESDFAPDPAYQTQIYKDEGYLYRMGRSFTAPGNYNDAQGAMFRDVTGELSQLAAQEKALKAQQGGHLEDYQTANFERQRQQLLDQQTDIGADMDTNFFKRLPAMLVGQTSFMSRYLPSESQAALMLEQKGFGTLAARTFGFASDDSYNQVVAQSAGLSAAGGSLSTLQPGSSSTQALAEAVKQAWAGSVLQIEIKMPDGTTQRTTAQVQHTNARTSGMSAFPGVGR